jgi:hypothetical protein
MDTIEFAVVVRVELRLHEKIVLDPIAFESLDDLRNPVDKDRFDLIGRRTVLSQSVRGNAETTKR